MFLINRSNDILCKYCLKTALKSWLKAIILKSQQMFKIIKKEGKEKKKEKKKKEKVSK